MSRPGSIASTLRAEARLLSIAGFQALTIGFPFTLSLVALALAGNVSPLLPLVIGGPVIYLGYLPCSLAARRLARAHRFEGRS